MTTRKETLQELLAKVEAGDGTNDGSMFRAFGDNWTKCYDAYNGSLDAAKALHEAVLPGWWWKVSSPVPHYCQVVLPEVGVYFGQSDTPARAWLIAIIKALIVQEGAG